MKELFQLFITFFKMGIFTIGGGLAMLPLIQYTIVDKKGWLSEEEMSDCIAVSQALPGVIAINAATYVGRSKKGLSGALAASLGVIMPSFLIIITAVIFLGVIGPNRYVDGAFTAIKATSCGLIAYAGYRLGRQIIKNKLGIMLGLGSFLLVVFLGVSAVWPVLLGGLIGFGAGRLK